MSHGVVPSACGNNTDGQFVLILSPSEQREGSLACYVRREILSVVVRVKALVEAAGLQPAVVPFQHRCVTELRLLQRQVLY